MRSVRTGYNRCKDRHVDGRKDVDGCKDRQQLTITLGMRSMRPSISGSDGSAGLAGPSWQVSQLWESAKMGGSTTCSSAWLYVVASSSSGSSQQLARAATTLFLSSPTFRHLTRQFSGASLRILWGSITTCLVFPALSVELLAILKYKS